MKIREEFTCPLELVQDMIKGKWKPIILWRLRLGATSLSKLEKDIDGITQKMLLEQLKELIEYGFVEKRSFVGYPLRVEYFLTEEMGMEILKALKSGVRADILKTIKDYGDDLVKNVVVKYADDLTTGVITMLENHWHIQLTMDGDTN